MTGKRRSGNSPTKRDVSSSRVQTRSSETESTATIASPTNGTTSRAIPVAQPLISQAGGFAARLVFDNSFAPQEYPAVNMYQTQDGYLLFAEMPGVRSNDIEIKLSHLTVEIRCRRAVDRSGDITFRRQERWHGWRQKFLHFPEPIDAQLAEAELSHGWLRLAVKKLPQATSITVPVIDRESDDEFVGRGGV